jgi:hypothetical protein
MPAFREGAVYLMSRVLRAARVFAISLGKFRQRVGKQGRIQRLDEVARKPRRL